jgi:hypothetical protein
MRCARTQRQRNGAAQHDQRLAEREAEVAACERQVRLVHLAGSRLRQLAQQRGRRDSGPTKAHARTLSISTSHSWLKPTMQTFMNSAGMMACSTPSAVVMFRSAGLLSAMSDTDTMLSCKAEEREELLQHADGAAAAARVERTTVPIMVCGRVKRTNALQKCRTASSGDVSHLRSRQASHAQSVQAHAAAASGPGTLPHPPAAGSDWNLSKVAAQVTAVEPRTRCVGLSKGCGRLVSTGRAAAGGATQHAVADARHSPAHVARRGEGGEEARRARKVRARKDGNCAGQAGWSTLEAAQAMRARGDALGQARTAAAARARRRREDRPRLLPSLR